MLESMRVEKKNEEEEEEEGWMYIGWLAVHGWPQNSSPLLHETVTI